MPTNTEMLKWTIFHYFQQVDKKVDIVPAFKEVEPSCDHDLLVSFSCVEGTVDSDWSHWGEMDLDKTYVRTCTLSPDGQMVKLYVCKFKRVLMEQLRGSDD